MQIGLAQWIFPHLKHRWNSNKMIRCIVEYFNIVCVFFLNFSRHLFSLGVEKGGGEGEEEGKREKRPFLLSIDLIVMKMIRAVDFPSLSLSLSHLI